MQTQAIGVPLFLWLLVIVVLPVAVAVFFGMFAFRTMEKLAFACQRCGEMFQRKAHHPFPSRCPRCHARDWNAR